MEDTRMKERLTSFIKIAQPDIKLQREEFMVSLRKKNKQAIFQANRFYRPGIYREEENAEIYEKDMKLLNLTEESEDKIKYLVNIITKTNSYEELISAIRICKVLSIRYKASKSKPAFSNKVRKSTEEYLSLLTKPMLKAYQVILEEQKSVQLCIQTIWLFANLLYIVSVDEILSFNQNDDSNSSGSIELSYGEREPRSYTKTLLSDIVNSICKIFEKSIENKSRENEVLIEVILLCIMNFCVHSKEFLRQVYDNGVLSFCCKLITSDLPKRFNAGSRYLLCTTSKLIENAESYIIENSIESTKEVIDTIEEITDKCTYLLCSIDDYEIICYLLIVLSKVVEKSERYLRKMLEYKNIVEKLIEFIGPVKIECDENGVYEGCIPKDAFILISIICSSDSFLKDSADKDCIGNIFSRAFIDQGIIENQIVSNKLKIN